MTTYLIDLENKQQSCRKKKSFLEAGRCKKKTLTPRVAVKFARAYKIAQGDKIARRYF